MDGVTLAPWQAGRLLVWNTICLDTFTNSYRIYATQEVGKVAENVEDRKVEKHQGLPASHSFTPIALGTISTIGLRSIAVLKDLRHLIATKMGDSYVEVD